MVVCVQYRPVGNVNQEDRVIGLLKEFLETLLALVEALFASLVIGPGGSKLGTDLARRRTASIRGIVRRSSAVDRPPPQHR